MISDPLHRHKPTCNQSPVQNTSPENIYQSNEDTFQNRTVRKVAEAQQSACCCVKTINNSSILKLLAPRHLSHFSTPSETPQQLANGLCVSRHLRNSLKYLLVPMASISSMKTMEGACSSATRKSSRTSLGPSPRYFWISSEPTTRRNVAEVWLATALASSVLPACSNRLGHTSWISNRMTATLPFHFSVDRMSFSEAFT